MGTEPPELLEQALPLTYVDCSRLGLRDRAREVLGFTDAACHGGRGEEARGQ